MSALSVVHVQRNQMSCKMDFFDKHTYHNWIVKTREVKLVLKKTKQIILSTFIFEHLGMIDSN